MTNGASKRGASAARAIAADARAAVRKARNAERMTASGIAMPDRARCLYHAGASIARAPQNQFVIPPAAESYENTRLPRVERARPVNDGELLLKPRMLIETS